MMDGRGGGCCVAGYAGGGIYMASKVDRILLRFRPIAPKPAAGGSLPVTTPDTRASDTTTKVSLKRLRMSRSREKRSSATKKRRSSPEVKSGCSSDGGDSKMVMMTKKKKKSETGAVVTLSLLPETPERKVTQKSSSPLPADLWLRKSGSGGFATEGVGLVLAPQPVRAVGSWVTVERVTGTACMDWICCDGVGASQGSDEELLRGLDRDTCPAFVSDRWDRVTWTNEAYRRMVAGGSEGEEVVVGLVMRESVPETLRSFSCRVRVHYGNGSGKERSSVTAPCDVWRIDTLGGFAWRLDTKAALCLGR